MSRTITKFAAGFAALSTLGLGAGSVYSHIKVNETEHALQACEAVTPTGPECDAERDLVDAFALARTLGTLGTIESGIACLCFIERIKRAPVHMISLAQRSTI